jgi:acyl dehydratase
MSVQQLDGAPSLARLYARAAVTGRGRHGDRLPDAAYQLRELRIDRDHLAGYNDVCGFRQSDVLPPTYPHILGFPAAVVLMVDPAFPFALPGLVHVNNRIEQRRPITADERLTITVHPQQLREHPRGRQFDMITEVTVGGEIVWIEASTYLHREHRRSPSSSTPSSRSDGPPQSQDTRATAVWRVPANIGRRYAAVSGDVNPIHLNPLAARLFGFPRAIAHGMWVTAHALAALEGRLQAAVIVEVEFKSPLLLPSTVNFVAGVREGAWSFAVAQARTGRPHFRGRALPLP